MIMKRSLFPYFQYGDLKGKLTDAVLHEVMSIIKRTIYNKYLTLVVNLHIEKELLTIGVVKSSKSP